MEFHILPWISLILSLTGVWGSSSSNKMDSSSSNKMGSSKYDSVAGSSGSTYSNKLRYLVYDYIVVGAGSAGAVIANRLSEDPQVTVLLLEAGGQPSNTSDVPAFSSKLVGSEMDWAYYTEPQANACQGLVNKSSYWPRGKGLGGTSSINSMLYVRGNPRDFDNWAQEGATGWNWKYVFKYFLKSEDESDSAFLSNGFHKSGGLQTVSSLGYVTPLRDAFLKAGETLGYPIVDANGPKQEGFARIQFNTRDGYRCSTEKAFLRPASARRNLDVLLNAYVFKVQFDSLKRATGVWFDRYSKTSYVRANREIVLSAGAIGSPQILMLSGVGPKTHLQDLVIDVVADLPVGENLHDHVTMGWLSYLLNDSVGCIAARDQTPEAFAQLAKGTGPLTIPAGIEGLAHFSSAYAKTFSNWPDIQILLFCSLYVSLGSLNPEQKASFGSPGSQNIVTVKAVALRPKSRGFIKLRSTNPKEHPIIDPCYLCNEEDLKVLVQGAKFVQQIMGTATMKRYGATIFPDVIKGCEEFETGGDEYLKCATKLLTFQGNHVVGTCKMGNPLDKTTVVDSKLRVKGVKGLRVADASVMPTVISGNPGATCVMIGEKASDMIRGRT